jgi:hypothetical protein
MFTALLENIDRPVDSSKVTRITCLTFYGPVVTICTARFNIHKFYVLPTQCIWFVWISEQTAIISLYSIN